MCIMMTLIALAIGTQQYYIRQYHRRSGAPPRRIDWTLSSYLGFAYVVMLLSFYIYFCTCEFDGSC